MDADAQPPAQAAASTDQTVLIEREDGIAWLTMNRPDKRNAMSTLNGEMLEALEELEVDDSIGVVVLTGAGESFTAGMNLKKISARPTAPRRSRSCAFAARRANGSGAGSGIFRSRRSRWSTAGASAARSRR